MPTGFTEGVADGTITSFRDYAKRCARCFGAFVMYRDEPLSPELPEIEESKYEKEEYEKALAEFQKYVWMSLEEAEHEAAEQHADNRTYHTKRIREKNAERKRYAKMLEAAKRFVPPTPQHREFAKFIVEQLEQSINFDCDVSYHELILKKNDLLSPEEYRGIKRKQSADALNRANASLRAAYERTRSKREWVSSLLAAIEQVEQGDQE